MTDSLDDEPNLMKNVSEPVDRLMNMTTSSLIHRPDLASTVAQAQTFPRIRYMGSKYRLLPQLAEVFESVGGRTAVDAFSGSGVVSYLLKTLGYSVTSNDFLTFPSVITRATVANWSETLDDAEVDAICGPTVDDRDFIQSTFEGLYFTPEDLRFFDSAWSHIDSMVGYKRDIAIAALVLSAARKQPRGVFTFTDPTKYFDGRRDLRLTMREHFREAVRDYNAVVFDNGVVSESLCGDVFDVPLIDPDIVYLDPPYAPKKDDADYTKRYHFLEGLSVYWQDMPIMENTKTKKIEKRHTPFASKRTVDDALVRVFEQFGDAGAIVMSYSSNALPESSRIVELLKTIKKDVQVTAVDYRYSFGTHSAALKTTAQELIFVAR